MTRRIRVALVCGVLAYAAAFAGTAGAQNGNKGQQVFRYDTFGDEQLWTDVLRMDQGLASVSPADALKVGLKVDVDALPPELIAALQAGQVDLTSPATTAALFRLDADCRGHRQGQRRWHVDECRHHVRAVPFDR